MVHSKGLLLRLGCFCKGSIAALELLKLHIRTGGWL